MEKIIEQIKQIEDKSELTSIYNDYDNLFYAEEQEEARKDITRIKLHIQSRIFELTQYKN